MIRNTSLFMKDFKLVLYCWKNTTDTQMIRMFILMLMVRFQILFILIDIPYDMLLVLDPVLKLQYLNVAWEEEYLTAGVESFKAWVS